MTKTPDRHAGEYDDVRALQKCRRAFREQMESDAAVITQLRAELADLKLEQNELNHDMDALAEQRDEIRAERDKLKAERDQYARTLSNRLETSVRTDLATSEIDTLTRERDDARATNLRLKADAKLLLKTNEELREELAKMTTRWVRDGATIAELRAEIETLRSRVTYPDGWANANPKRCTRDENTYHTRLKEPTHG